MESNELSNKMIESIISDENVQEIFTDLTDFSFDQILDSPLNEFPIIKNFISVAKFGISVRDKFLINKILRFLKYLPKNNDESRAKFKNKIQSDPDYSKKIGEHLIIILDRYDHLTKAEYLSKIFSAYLDEKISLQEFLRLSTAIERSFIDDLNKLDQYYRRELFDVEDFILQNLYQCGLVGLLFNKINSEKSQIEVPSVFYVKNDLGVLLCSILSNAFQDSQLIVPILNEIENKVFEKICIEEDIVRDYYDMNTTISRVLLSFGLDEDSLAHILLRIEKNNLIERVQKNIGGHYLRFFTLFVGYDFYFQKASDRIINIKTIINALLEDSLRDSSTFSTQINQSQRRVDHVLELLNKYNLILIRRHTSGILIDKINRKELEEYLSKLNY